MPQCTLCGQEVSFIPQYQQWYCPYCRTYPYLQQAAAQQYVQASHPNIYYQMQQPAYQPQYYPLMPQYQPPVVGPNPVNARNRIHHSFMLRKTTDQVIPTYWAWIILIFQIILPLSAIIAIYALAVGATFSASATGVLLLLILGVLLVSIGLAVTHALLTYRLVKRRDEHFRRDRMLAEGMAEYLGAVALSTGIDLNVERWTMGSILYAGNTRERSASLWAMLVALIGIIPILGIFFLVYSQMFLTKDIQEHDEKQRYFNYQYQTGLARAGKLGTDSFIWEPLPKRDVSAYVILTILTLGMFLPYWWYVNIVDMNTHIANQQRFEDMLVKKIQADG